MTRYVAIAEIRAALDGAPQACRYHGTDFGFLGTENGQPWCESCRQPWRVVRALAALEQLDARLINMQAAERENPALRRALDDRGERIKALGAELDELRAASQRFAENVGRAVGELTGLREAATR